MLLVIVKRPKLNNGLNLKQNTSVRKNIQNYEQSIIE